MNQVISYGEARKQGLKHYFTGKPCKRGHIDIRFVTNRTCNSCLYDGHKEWKKDNHSIFLESVKRYKKSNPEKVKVWSAKYIRSKESRRRSYEVQKIRLALNPAIRKKTAELARNRRKKNPMHFSAVAKQWRMKNRERDLARRRHYQALRNTRKNNAFPLWADKYAIKEIYKKAAKLGMVVDHIIPLSGVNVCGLHVETNLQVITKMENLRKSNKFDEEDWMKKHGFKYLSSDPNEEIQDATSRRQRRDALVRLIADTSKLRRAA